MNCDGQICCNIMVSYFKWRHNASTGKSPLLSWKVFTWIMMKTCVLCTSHKIHLSSNLLKQTKLLSSCFTTTVNQAATSFKNFNNSRKLYIWCFNPCYHNLPMRIYCCACICWLFQFSGSVYCFLYKWRFAVFHLSRVSTVLC